MPAHVVPGVILANVTYVSLGGWLVLIGCILTIWVLYSAIGIAVSSRLRSQREVWPVGNLLFTFLGILSPLYYPISILPPVWGEVARLLPATYAALLVQGALGLGGPANLPVDGGLLVLSTAVGLVAAWRLYEWRGGGPRRPLFPSFGWAPPIPAPPRRRGPWPPARTC